MTEQQEQAQPDDKREPRRKTDAEKQQQKDEMINLWMGNMDQEKETKKE